jgi:hypothetical protein
MSNQFNGNFDEFITHLDDMKLKGDSQTTRQVAGICKNTTSQQEPQVEKDRASKDKENVEPRQQERVK